MTRQHTVAQSIVQAIQSPPTTTSESTARLRRKLRLLFVLHRLQLDRHRIDTFQQLRSNWYLADREYDSSFKHATDLQSHGDMGYSGSVRTPDTVYIDESNVYQTFFVTQDGNFIVKSIPRRFEHSFFRDDLLDRYAAHQLANADSLLTRITDFLVPTAFSIGGWIGLVPTHHIIMENLLYGRNSTTDSEGVDWEIWDLKPDSYFFPERDIAGGRLTSQATKSQLTDEFNDKIVLSRPQAEEFLACLDKDTKLLEEANAVDYSLFLVRIPLPKYSNPFDDDADHDVGSASDAAEPLQHPPFAPPDPPSWRTGVRSHDGKYLFRATIIDFFWAKHKIHAKAMTLLINAWNLINRRGPMSITTTPDEYRQRFLRMCNSFVEIQSDK